MGKARVLAAKGAGLYDIEILEDRVRANTARSLAVGHIAELDTLLAELEIELGEAQAAVDDAAAAQDQAIVDYQAALADDEIDTAEAREAMVEAGTALTEAAATRDGVQRRIARLKAERLALQARIARIDALPALRQIEAWCADYTEALEGEVATAEVPGEIGQVVIKPGHEDGATWSASADGAIQPALSGTAASVFYNLAMLPGWQRHRPAFRFATISDIDTNADTCSITLKPATSSQQALDVNPQDSYTGVPVQYMTCNAAAFADGDSVVVMFEAQDTTAPRVIGFESHPKRCEITGFLSVEDCLVQWYGEPLVTALDVNQEQDRLEQRVAFGSDYFCEVSGETFTETSPTLSTAVTGTFTRNLLVDNLDQALPADVSAVDDQLADDAAMGGGFECDGLALNSSYQHAADKDISWGAGSAGSQNDGEGPWDSGCADGYTFDRSYSADTTYGHQASGLVSGNTLSIAWERDTDHRMWFDWSDSEFGYAIPLEYNIPGSVTPDRNLSAVDTVTLGGVSVDITAVNAHFGNADRAMSRMDLASWLPEIFVTRRPEGDYAALLVCSLSGTTIEHYIIAFERVSEAWQRCDVPAFMETEIPDLSRREAVLEQVTGDAYSSTFTSVPGSVG